MTNMTNEDTNQIREKKPLTETKTTERTRTPATPARPASDKTTTTRLSGKPVDDGKRTPFERK